MKARLWPLLLLSIGIAATVLLSVGLSGLTLLPGKPYFLGGRLWLGANESELSLPSETLVKVIRIFFIILLLLLPVSIVYLIISPTARRQLRRDLTIFGSVLLLFWLIRTRLGALNSESGAQPDAAPLVPETIPSLLIAEFVAAPPQWLIWLTSFGLAALLVLALAGIVWRVRFYRQPSPSSLMQIAQQAQEALDALQAGGNCRDTVMRCYFEMNHVLHERRGIRLPEAMTPREFEIQLEKAGLPGEHIQQLTRLFESVRYGAKVSGEREEQQAIACLSAIVEACKSSS